MAFHYNRRMLSENRRLGKTGEMDLEATKYLHPIYKNLIIYFDKKSYHLYITKTEYII